VPTGAPVHLVVAAVLEAESSIEIPSLTGLSLPEAQKALESLGLVLGKVVTKQQRPG
jgi:beta-lactam-binding protein with PASTA domain